MDFAFSDEQEQLRDVVRKYLATRSSEADVRRLMATTDGYDAVVWKDMAEQLGLQGIMVPERYGGGGFGFLELSVILEEMGRALLCAPYFSTAVLAVRVLLAADDERACEEYLPRIASGDLVATVATPAPAGVGDDIAVTAVTDGGGYRLDGVAEHVIDGHLADLVLVPATIASGRPPSLFAISPARVLSPEVLARIPLPTLDETRKVARVELRGAPATLLGAPETAGSVVDAVFVDAAVALASELVGVCQWGVATSAEYARTRQQFGRPIGSFQAIKHKCVDMLVELEAAKALAYYAAWTAESGAPDLGVMSSLAKAECGDAARNVTTETLHVHGGSGFTWDNPAHLYLKRATCSALLFGDAAFHRERVCAGIGL